MTRIANRPSWTRLLLALAGVALTRQAGADSLTVECQTLPGGGFSLVVETESGDPSVALREGRVEITVPDPAPADWEMLARTCRRVASTTLVPGTVLGTPTSSLLVKPVESLGQPRVVTAPGRVRLLWLAAAPAPVAEGRQGGEAAVAEARQAAAGLPGAEPEAAPEAAPEASASTLEAPHEMPSAAPETAQAAPKAAKQARRAQKAERAGLARPEPETPPEAGAAEGGASRPVDAAVVAVPAAVADAGPASVAPVGSVAAAAPPEPAGRGARQAAAAAQVTPLEPPVTLRATLGTEVRQGPGRSERSLGSIAAGQVVTANGRSGDWLRLAGGGWVFGPYFEASSTPREFTARVVAEKAQVRSGPGPQHDLVAEIYRDENVAVDDVSGEWAHVRNGGWVPLAALAR